MNLCAISGFRAKVVDEGLVLPVGHGYSVRITLAADDTYTVSRVFIRSGRIFLHGVREGVYCEDIGQVAYYASCYQSYDAAEWVRK